jgi:single-strand DNA-binding protein
MNLVQLIGNLASEVEGRELSGGKRLASFLLAVDRASEDGGADFIRVVVWERQAELCERFLSKGKRVAVEGRLRSRSWQAEDGTRRSALEVVAQRVEFLSPPEGREIEEDIPFAEAGVP